MKVVINTCFGGFGLSPAGMARYYELKGRPCYFFTSKMLDGSFDIHRYRPISQEEAEASGLFFSCFDIPNPNEVCAYSGDWYKLSAEQQKKQNEAYSSHHLCHNDIERNDPDLIRVVEELGDRANGQCAELSVVEIPDGVDWEIDEYDGNESIHEVHRSWR